MLKNETLGKLQNEAFDKLGPLLSLWLTLKKFTGKEMVAFLEDKYQFEIEAKVSTDDAKAEFIMNLSNGKNKLLRTEVHVDVWEKIISDFEKELISEVKKFVYKDDYEKSFSAKSKFNWVSVYSLIDEISTANSIIFFNSFIGNEEWFDPIVQMHMGIQKSIEQKMNYSKVQDCHNNHNPSDKKKNEFINKCNDNPPIYRQYRILFYPKTREQLKKLVKSENKEYDTLAYVSYLHTSLSIQLAIFTLDDWFETIQRNKPFFSDIENLKGLKLVESGVTAFNIVSLNKVDLGNHILGCLHSQSNMPFEKVSEGIDFLFANNNAWNNSASTVDIDGSIYTTFYEKNNEESNGVNYFIVDDEKIANIKKRFTNIVFNHIIQKGFASKNHSHKKLDPIHSFYSINDQKHYWKFTDQHDASLNLNLDK